MPTTACPPGELAIPGDATCRTVDTCTDAPDDPATIHVDRASTAPTPDGTRAAPFKTIQAALDALSTTRTTIAIAGGTYVENLIVRRPARIVGRCAAEVELEGASASDPALTIGSTVVVEHLAVTGAGIGIAVADAKGVVLDHVRVHDTAYIGIAALRRTRATEVVVRDSLIERAHESGVTASGALLTLERSVVRDTTSARPAVPAGFGVSALFNDTSKTAADVRVVRSSVERSVLVAVSVVGSRVSMEGSLVRDTRGTALKATPGSGGPPDVRVIGSVFEGSRDFGVELLDCAASFERSVIRRVEGGAGATGGALGVRGGQLTLLDSLIEDARGIGVALAAPARVERTIVRRIAPLATAGTGELGVGLAITGPFDVSLTNLLVAETTTAGVLALGANLTLGGSRLRDTRATSNALFGDGLVLIATADDAGAVTAARATVEKTEILRSARAGVATFASSVSLASSRIACAALEIAVVPRFIDKNGVSVESEATLRDLGENSCGCETPASCRASATSIEPIPPLGKE